MTAPTRPSNRRTRQDSVAHWLDRATRVAGVVVGVLVVALVVTVATGEPRSAGPDADLPNPMGGPAIAAPAATGDPVALGGLEVAAPDVTMGDVPLNVTVVPGWEVANPTDAALTFTVGQPQVLEGCCPGPVHVDGSEVPTGGTFTVEPGTSVTVQFPLQMHPGMDGPHHLTVPVQADGGATQLHVTGNFTADA